MLTEGNLQSSWLLVGQDGSLDSLLHGHGFSVCKYSNGGLSIDGHQFWRNRGWTESMLLYNPLHEFQPADPVL